MPACLVTQVERVVEEVCLVCNEEERLWIWRWKDLGNVSAALTLVSFCLQLLARQTTLGMGTTARQHRLVGDLGNRFRHFVTK